jgi:hypothetical protein
MILGYIHSTPWKYRRLFMTAHDEWYIEQQQGAVPLEIDARTNGQ